METPIAPTDENMSVVKREEEEELGTAAAKIRLLHLSMCSYLKN